MEATPVSHKDNKMRERKKIRGQQISIIISTVSDFFSAYYHGKLGKPKLYIISPPYIYSIQSFFLPDKGLVKRIKSSLKYGISHCAIYCPFQCELIWVKNNIRIFGLPDNPKITVKLQGDNTLKHGDEIRNEIEIRKRLAEIPFLPLRMPALYDSGSSLRLVEEYIPGRRPEIRTDKDVIVDFLEHQLVDFYKLFICPQRLVDTLNLKQIEWRTLCENWPRDKMQLLKQHPTHYWAVSLCHNDLSFGNTLLYRNELYLLDWEEALRNPTAIDFENILTSNPSFLSNCLNSLDKLNKCLICNKNSIIPPRIQIALSAVIKLIELNKDINKMIHYFEISKNLNYKQAFERTLEYEEKKRGIIEMVLEGKRWKETVDRN